MQRLSLLGGVDLGPHDGRRPGILTQPRRLGLLAYLSLQPPDAWVRRDRLLPVFWPELDESRARAALSQSLHVLRRSLGPEVVATRGADELRLDDAGLDVDVRRFEAGCGRGDWEQALAEYRGELLPGFHLDDAPEFERWLETRRAGLHRQALEAAHALAARADAEGDAVRAVAARRRALELDPHDEAGLHALALLLHRLGRRTEALRTCESFMARLREELELEPSAGTLALCESLRQADPPSRAEEPRVTPTAAAAGTPPPVAAPSPAATPVRRRTRFAVALALAVLAVGAVAVRALGTRPASSALKVTVLPFAVRGASELDYLREGMVDLLATKLDALGTVQAVAPEAVFARLGDDLGARPNGLTPEDGAAIARAFGSDLFVLGHVVRVGRAIELSALLFDASGERAGVATRRADDEDALPAAIDDLVRDLVAARLSAPADRLGRLAAVSTTSHQALRHYLEGERRYREGRYGESLEAFRAAATADTLFALAFYRVSVAAGWVADGEQYVPAARRAAELGDRLTDHDRTLVRAHYAYTQGDYDAAERGFRSIVARWPDDAEAWYDLGETLFHGNPRRGRPMAEARDPFERAGRLVGASAEATAHRLVLRLIAGEAAGTGPLFDSVLALYPPASSRHRIHRVLQVAVHGDGDALEREVAALAGHPPDDVIVTAWAVACYTDRLGLADTLLRGLVTDRSALDTRIVARSLLAQLHLARGQWAAAAQELERLSALDRAQAGLLASRFAAVAPLVGLPRGDSAAALQLIDRLSRAPDAPARPEGGMGLTGVQRYRLADSLFAAGRLEEARGWFESIPIIFQDDLPLLAPAQLRLGALYEAVGRPEAAERAYRRALELWAASDAHLGPSLAHARARLAALASR